MSSPLRTCVICRKKAKKAELVRFVWDDGYPVHDEHKRMDGRGAYCCPDHGCKEKFLTLGSKLQKIFRK